MNFIFTFALLIVSSDIALCNPTTNTNPNTNNNEEDKDSSSNSCVYTIESATYDLNLLHIPAQSEKKFHLVSDADPARAYKYYFNFCDKVQHMPLDICTNSSLRPSFAQGYCPVSDSTILPNSTQYQCPKDIIPITNNAYAYQVDESADKCFRLSNEIGGPPTWRLYDINDPSAGIVMLLNSGDYSPHCKNPTQNRNLEIQLRCDPANVGIDLSSIASISEDSDKHVCSFQMELETFLGCPTQCGIIDMGLCNNHGICSYDFTNQYPKCFCFSQFTGDACQKETGSDGNGNDDGLIYADSLLTPIFEHNTAKIQYDLRSYKMNDVVNDNDGLISPYISMKDYKFHFQFEENIEQDKLPQSCSNSLLACNKIENPNCQNVSLNVDALGTAFRIDNRDNSCVLLAAQSQFETGLFDMKRPAKGIVVTYTGGYNPVTNENFAFRIELECPNMGLDYYQRIANQTEADPQSQLVEVRSFDANTYSVHFSSPLACPTACRMYSDDDSDPLYICSARGVCALDPFEKQTHCLCDDGWQGRYCSVEQTDDNSSMNGGNNVLNSAGFISIIVILSILLVSVSVVGYLKYQHWKQKAELAYAQFGDDELIDDLVTVGPGPHSQQMQGHNEADIIIL